MHSIINLEMLSTYSRFFLHNNDDRANHAAAEEVKITAKLYELLWVFEIKSGPPWKYPAVPWVYAAYVF